MRVFIVAVAPGSDNDPALCLSMFQERSFSSPFRHKLVQEFSTHSRNDTLFSSHKKGFHLPVNLCSVSKAKSDSACVPINA